MLSVANPSVFSRVQEHFKTRRVLEHFQDLRRRQNSGAKGLSSVPSGFLLDAVRRELSDLVRSDPAWFSTEAGRRVAGEGLRVGGVFGRDVACILFSAGADVADALPWAFSIGGAQRIALPEGLTPGVALEVARHACRPGSASVGSAGLYLDAAVSAGVLSSAFSRSEAWPEAFLLLAGTGLGLSDPSERVSAVWQVSQRVSAELNRFNGFYGEGSLVVREWIRTCEERECLLVAKPKSGFLQRRQGRL